MTIAEQMRREGEARGRAAVVRKQLVLKFGRLSAEHEARIDRATPEDLDRWAERVLTAATIDAVFQG